MVNIFPQSSSPPPLSNRAERRLDLRQPHGCYSPLTFREQGTILQRTILSDWRYFWYFDIICITLQMKYDPQLCKRCIAKLSGLSGEGHAESSEHKLISVCSVLIWPEIVGKRSTADFNISTTINGKAIRWTYSMDIYFFKGYHKIRNEHIVEDTLLCAS